MGFCKPCEKSWADHLNHFRWDILLFTVNKADRLFWNSEETQQKHLVPEFRSLTLMQWFILWMLQAELSGFFIKLTGKASH